jgi:hypothetical protein
MLECPLKTIDAVSKRATGTGLQVERDREIEAFPGGMSLSMSSR